MFSFFQRTGKAVNLIQKLVKQDQFHRARIDQVSRKRKGLKRLIIGIGQVHPVLHGRFGYLQARQIGSVQAWIFSACRFLHKRVSVPSFGQEGFSLEGSQNVHVRLHESVIREFRKVVDHYTEVRGYLLKMAQKWRRALKKGKKEDIKEAASALDALTLLQVIEKKVAVFPIEQLDLHTYIGEEIMRLQKKIKKIEASPIYKRYEKKEGKGLSKSEYKAAVQRNNLVKEFNRILKHPKRDKSIFFEILEYAEQLPVTVFILGQGHKSAQLRLARKHLPDDTLFVWMTPPHLWWWRATLMKIFWTSALVLIGAIVSWFLFIGVAPTAAAQVFGPIPTLRELFENQVDPEPSADTASEGSKLIFGPIPNFLKPNLFGPRINVYDQQPRVSGAAEPNTTLGPTPSIVREGLFGPIPTMEELWGN